MDNERSAIITIDGTEYPLTLTTYATKKIVERYGGIESLGDKIMNSDHAELALAEIVWIIVLLANQRIMADNLRRVNPPRELLTEEAVELLTQPVELLSFRDAIMEAFIKGTKRDVESEAAGDESKNAPVG
ncbi:hypothetical protein AGMMS49992_31560 [Clostridia bacterium]|nr:hypothetical protein AGMMS49992_31560 [Clostridia bacterium]